MSSEQRPDPDLIPTLTEVLEIPDLGEVPAAEPLAVRAPSTAARSAAAPDPAIRAIPSLSAETGLDPAAERLAAEVAEQMMRLLEPVVQQLAREAVRRELDAEGAL